MTKKRAGQRQLTDLEGVVIAFVYRRQPCTPYKIRQSFEKSPTMKFSASAGSIYPLVHRLAKRGFLVEKSREKGGRRSTTYCVSEKGKRKVKSWLNDLTTPEQIGVYDPIRTRLANLSLLSRSDQISWIGNVMKILERQQAVVERYESQRFVGDQDLYESICEMLWAENRFRIEWLTNTRDTLRRRENVA